MNSYFLEWLGINDMGLSFRHRLFVVATDQESARRELVSRAVEWGCQVRKIECLGSCPVQKE